MIELPTCGRCETGRRLKEHLGGRMELHRERLEGSAQIPMDEPQALFPVVRHPALAIEIFREDDAHVVERVIPLSKQTHLGTEHGKDGLEPFTALSYPKKLVALLACDEFDDPVVGPQLAAVAAVRLTSWEGRIVATAGYAG